MTRTAVWHVLTGFPNNASSGTTVLHLQGCSHTYWRGIPGHLMPATPAQLASPDYRKCRDCLNRESA